MDECALWVHMRARLTAGFLGACSSCTSTLWAHTEEIRTGWSNIEWSYRQRAQGTPVAARFDQLGSTIQSLHGGGRVGLGSVFSSFRAAVKEEESCCIGRFVQ